MFLVYTVCAKKWRQEDIYTAICMVYLWKNMLEIDSRVALGIGTQE